MSNWDPTVPYEVYDYSSYAGKLWMAVAPNTNVTPGSNDQIWILFVTPNSPYAPPPSGFGGFTTGLYTGHETLGETDFGTDVVFPSAEEPVNFSCRVAPTSNAVFPLDELNGGVETNVGSAEILAGQLTGVVTWNTNPYTLKQGRKIIMYAPVTADPTLSHVSWRIPGTKAS